MTSGALGIGASGIVTPGIGWGAIARIGVVQATIGMIVVLSTSILNRVMVVELRLAATVPGLLIALHYALQMLRPRWGHGSDALRSRTPWIIGGMAILCLGGVLACTGVAVMATRFWPGLALAATAYAMIGIGAGAAGTTLLTLLADSVAPARRAAAGSLVWIMMIVGFVVAAGSIGALLSPFGFARLVSVGGGVSAAAFVLAVIAIRGVERPRSPAQAKEVNPPFATALRAVWEDDEARRFAIFIFVSMLAYGAQELILEPFAALVFHLSPAQTAGLTALQNQGALLGMVTIAIGGRWLGGGGAAGLRRLTTIGCIGSAAGLATIAAAGSWAAAPLLHPGVMLLGFANGVFAVSAIGLMMGMAGGSNGTDAGVRMGVWGAAQAVAFGGGGLVGAAGVDGVRLAIGAVVPAYAAIFLAEAVLFVAAGAMMVRGNRHMHGLDAVPAA